MIMETFRKTFKRKGVSPLIALVLGVIITIAIAVVLTGWLQRYSIETIRSVENESSAIDCTQSLIEISDVYINTTNDDVAAIIRNVGYSDVNLKEVNLYVTNFSYCPLNISSSSGKIDKGGTYRATNDSCDLISSNCNNLDKIRATTSCPGVVDVFDKDNSEDYSHLTCGS